MNFSITFLLSVLPCIFAQYGNPPSSPTKSSGAAPSSTGTATPGVHTVEAGNGNLAYSPSSITAAVGETIEFHFFPPLHSVAQGDFATPCTPPANGTGFFSGDITTSSGENTNVFTIKINDTNPIWFYCVIPTHCQAGMSGVINPPADGSMTLAQYQLAAGKVASSVAPASVQGGVLGPVKAATTSSSTPSPSSKSAGVPTGGGVQWVMFALTGTVAIAVGGLLL
jgi:plastocyanin